MSEKRCPACGAMIDSNATECKYCGSAIANEQANNGGTAYFNSNNQSKENGKYTYLKPYYQEQFQQIEQSGEAYKGKWNWCAFFFSWIWALTKGLWVLAIVTIVVDGIFSAMRLSWISLVISIVWGVRGNYFYYNLVNNNSQIPNKI